MPVAGRRNCDVLDVQKQRAEADDWAAHAAAELAGTYDYSSVAKITKRVAEVFPSPYLLLGGHSQCVCVRAHLEQCTLCPPPPFPIPHTPVLRCHTLSIHTHASVRAQVRACVPTPA